MEKTLKQFQKLVVTVIGGIILLLGILMIILPGPAIIIIPLALYILNAEHPEKVRKYVRKFQRGLSSFASWLDSKLRQWA